MFTYNVYGERFSCKEPCLWNAFVVYSTLVGNDYGHPFGWPCVVSGTNQLACCREKIEENMNRYLCLGRKMEGVAALLQPRPT